MDFNMVPGGGAVSKAVSAYIAEQVGIDPNKDIEQARQDLTPFIESYIEELEEKTLAGDQEATRALSALVIISVLG